MHHLLWSGGLPTKLKSLRNCQLSLDRQQWHNWHFGLNLGPFQFSRAEAFARELIGKQASTSWLLSQLCGKRRLACHVSSWAPPSDLNCGKVIAIRSLSASLARTPASFSRYSWLDSHLPVSHFSVVSFFRHTRHSGAVKHQVLILGVWNFDPGSSQTELWKSMNCLNNITLYNTSPPSTTAQDTF